MATQNILKIGDAFNRGTSEHLMFRWGHIFAYMYDIGDKIDWAFAYRPKEADGELSIPAYLDTGPEYRMEYFDIIISNDVILEFLPSTLEEFEKKDDTFENLMRDPND